MISSRLYNRASVLFLALTGVGRTPHSPAAHSQRAGRGEAVAAQQERRSGTDCGEGESQKDAV